MHQIDMYMDDASANKALKIAGGVFLIILLFAGATSFIGTSAAVPDSTSSNPADNTFYAISTINVRSCASLDCKVIAQFPKGFVLNFPYASEAALPDWVPWTDSSDTVIGYISKNVISSTVVSSGVGVLPTGGSASAQINDVPSNSDNTSFSAPDGTVPGQKGDSTFSTNFNASTNATIDLRSIVKEWSPRVARIFCTDGSYDYTGSGVLTRMDFTSYGLTNIPALVTNRHVFISSITGDVLTNCNFQVPDTNDIFTINTASVKTMTNEDVAFVSATSASAAHLPSGVTTPFLVCNAADVSIGDSIAILGYPIDGGTGEASTAITLTQGIISSYDGEYYVTDAKIDHGNSGGAAILLRKDCYLGIPSWVQTGGFESLGRILSAKYIFNN